MADWAQAPPIPTSSIGTSLLRSSPVRQVAQPIATSLVSVSQTTIDQVARADEARVATATATSTAGRMR